MHFSIVVPVLNEEVVLEEQLVHLTWQCVDHHCELLIVDGGSDDRTVAIAERFGRVLSSPRGRATQMNVGAAAARGEVLIFLHADTRLPDDAFFTGDQAYFVRATSFRAVGGYPDQPLMEDLEIILRLRKIGKVVLLPQYVTTSARRHEKIGLLHSVLFMWYLRTLYKFGVSPVQLQRMYIDVR